MKKLLLACLLLIASPSYANDIPQRIVSTGGALTEIIYQLGAQDTLVGTDTTSYYPPAADKIAKVGYQRGLSSEGIISLNPDLIIHTNEAGPATVFKQLKSAKVKSLQLKAGRSMDDVIYNINTLATLLNKQKEGKKMIEKIKKQQSALQKAVASAAYKPRVLIVHRHGGGTPAAAGTNTAADSMITLSGGINVISDFTGYKPLSPESAIALAPDIIIVAAPKADEIKDPTTLITHPALANTPAGKNGHIIAMDALFTLGFGPRTVEAAQVLHKAYGQL